MPDEPASAVLMYPWASDNASVLCLETINAAVSKAEIGWKDDKEVLTNVLVLGNILRAIPHWEGYILHSNWVIELPRIIFLLVYYS